MQPKTASSAGEGKPEVFNFLGFTDICGRTRRTRKTGRFIVKRKTIRSDSPPSSVS